MWSVIGYVLLSLLGLLLLFLILPVYARVRYREELTVTVRVFGIPVYRYCSAKASKGKSKKRADKPAEKTQKKKNTFLSDLSARLKSDGVRAVVDEIGALARLADGAFRRVARTVAVDRLQLQLVIASEDAAATAQDTGKVCAVLYPSLTTIQAVIRIRRRAVTVLPDYLGEKSRAEADVLVHALPVRLLGTALWALLSYGALQSHKSAKMKEELENGQ